MYYQRNVIDLIHKSFQCYYYNLYTKNLILHYQTLIIEKFYNASKLSKNTFTTEAHYKFVISALTPILKDTFHSFTNLYFEYNLNLEKDINLMFTQRQFKKIGGFWEEINYISDYSTEMDTVIYNIYSILDIDESEEEIMKDINNFIFKNGINKKNNKDRINSSFIKLMYYFIINYELTWKDIFDQIDEIIIDNYQNYVEYKLKINYGLEIIGLSFIVIFYIFVIIYLFYANNIIIKNIIFLFLDFSDDNLKSIGNNTTKIMMIKLLEFKNCIFDFSLEKLSLYSKNLENIEQNKYNSVSTIFKNYTGVNSTFERSDSINSDNKSIMSNNIEKRQHLSFKKNEEEINKKQTRKESNKFLTKDEASNMSNNSSVNYLNRTNSTFLKDKLNNNNILINTNQTSTISTNNINNQIINIPISKINNTNNKNDYVRISNRLYRKTRKDNLGNNINDKNIIESTESIQDIILNKSNKSDILLIKIYSVITYILLFLIIIYSILKLIAE